MLLLLFLLLMSSGIPVAIAMAARRCSISCGPATLPPFVVVHRMVSGIDSFPLLAVPFFILAGNLMNNAGITNRIYNYAPALVGWLKGGLGHVNVIRLGGLRRHERDGDRRRRGPGHDRDQGDADHGYDTEFAVGVTAASATLGRSSRRRCRS